MALALNKLFDMPLNKETKTRNTVKKTGNFWEQSDDLVNRIFSAFTRLIFIDIILRLYKIWANIFEKIDVRS